MNILFLDIDGVLNCQDYYTNGRKHTTYPLSEICPERVGYLNSLCKDFNVKVVISSSWRHGRTLEEMHNILIAVGATFEIIGYTPTIDLRFPYAVRGNEIKAWLEQNVTSISWQYKTYAILDDDADMLLEQKDHFFQTDATGKGLTIEICNDIANFFINKP